MAQPTAVILVVGLTRGVIGEHTPRLRDFAAQGEVRTLIPVLPAVTCSVQASMLTGEAVGGERGHGIVGNGWYDRELAEVHFWKQSNRLVGGEKVWETSARKGARKGGRDARVTCANVCWWYNMYSSVEYSLTPRPMYKADGRKVPDCHTFPSELREYVQGELGRFPLFQFWGPGASIRSSKWIGDAARLIVARHRPTLTLVYLPHLDYAHQKHGPDAPESRAAATEVDGVFGELVDFLRGRGIRPVVVSEYGIEPVSRAIPINRLLREAGFLAVRSEEGLEVLDAGASAAFAVADHQVAHVYVRDVAQVEGVAGVLSATAGIERCLNRGEMRAAGLDHRRAGDLLVVAAEGTWFSYAWWMDDARAPDFARTVDIHRKPGYDPLELFLDPSIRFPKLMIARKLLLRKLGSRTLMDVIPLDTSLVRGSHGRVSVRPEHRPVLITEKKLLDAPETLSCQVVRDVILAHLFDETRLPET